MSNERHRVQAALREAFVSAVPAARETKVGLTSASLTLPDIAKILSTVPPDPWTGKALLMSRNRAHKLQRQTLLLRRILVPIEAAGRQLIGIVGKTVDGRHRSVQTASHSPP